MQPAAVISATRVAPLAAIEEWDEFVAATPTATFFHRAGWRAVLEEAFGFRAHYLTARRDDRVVGVLPLCELRPPVGKPHLLSLPFAVEAGVSAVDEPARRALDAAALARAREIGAHSLELRDGIDDDSFQLMSGAYCRFRRRLLPGDQENFATIPRKRRRMIRLGQRSGLRARIDAGDDVFYDLYARTQRRLGTPLLPRRYFASLRRHFADDALVLTVWHGDVAVAGVFSFLFRDAILPYYAGSRDEYFQYGANDFMYWELMRLACARGLQTFDFGRSRRGSGAFDYKRHWGFTPEPLSYRVHSLGRGALTQRTVDDARIRLLRRGWRYVPLPLTKIIGPWIAQRFAPYFT